MVGGIALMDSEHERMARRDSAPILFVEDDENDVIFLRLALEQAGVPNRVISLSTAEEAVNYLMGAPPYEDRIAHPLPGLLLLDLHVRRSTAYDVLARLKTRPELRALPTVVLSGSADYSEGDEAKRRGASDFEMKPHRFSDLVDLVKRWQTRWLAPASQSTSSSS